MDAVLNNLGRSVPIEFGEFIAYADDLKCLKLKEIQGRKYSPTQK